MGLFVLIVPYLTLLTNLVKMELTLRSARSSRGGDTEKMTMGFLLILEISAPKKVCRLWRLIEKKKTLPVYLLTRIKRNIVTKGYYSLLEGLTANHLYCHLGSNNMKFKITPHKGGRSVRLNVRITPDEKAKLMAVAKKNGLSVVDWIMEKVYENPQKKIK
jgi:hypothetical protein